MVSDKLRLFIGVRVSVEAAAAIARTARAMQEAAEDAGPVARWVPPANYHITLKFLGWTHAPTALAVIDEVGAALAGAEPFEVETTGLGAFPKPEKARVLWAGARDAEGRLADLAARVGAATERLGFEAESRSFHPHVTLARLKTPADVTSLFECAGEQEFRRSWVDSVVLFKSEMKSTGSEYTQHALWPLDPPGSGSRRQT